MYMEKQEALEWLKNNQNLSALATNRFGKTENAIEFVEKLYHLGAVQVSVLGILDEPWRIQSEGGPYASTLHVELPDDKESTEKIKNIYREEFKNEIEYAADMRNDSHALFFWWD